MNEPLTSATKARSSEEDGSLYAAVERAVSAASYKSIGAWLIHERDKARSSDLTEEDGSLYAAV